MLTEGVVGGGEHRRRYVVCYNPEQARRQRHHREQVLRELEAELDSLAAQFVVHSHDDTLSATDIALGYKQLQRVEFAWRQLKSGLRLRPVYHWAVHRIHAHVSLTVLALLLERMPPLSG